MKIREKINILISIILVMSCIHLMAQQQPVSGSGFKLVMINEKQVSPTVFEFDLYLVTTDAKVPFRLASVQAGITVNPLILNGGAITPSFVPGSSELVDYQQPKSILFSDNCIKMFTNLGRIGEKSPPNDLRGSVISSTEPGTRICRIRITNSVEFKNAPANLAFSFQIKPYPTRVAQYINDINTQLQVTEQNCLVRTDNKPLNPPKQK